MRRSRAVSRLHTDAAASEQTWVCSLMWENVLFAEHNALRAQATPVEALTLEHVRWQNKIFGVLFIAGVT